MNSLGKGLTWTKGMIFQPKWVKNSQMCRLKFGYPHFKLQGNDTSQEGIGYFVQSPRTLAVDFVAKYLDCAYEYVFAADDLEYEKLLWQGKIDAFSSVY